MTASTRPTRPDPVELPLLEGGHSMAALSDRIALRPQRPFSRAWLAGLGLAVATASVGLLSAAWLLYRGIGVWGVAIPAAWGLAIVNFVWWIGIGHAGTLISAILLLLRQDWRNSINRLAEAMTVFAVMMAGVFPLLHLGRPWKFYYLFPYPNQMGVWPQWRSPLVWDAVAVSVYGSVSLVFWYLGLLPDLATMRDSLRRTSARRLVGVAALGWRGTADQWRHLKVAYLMLAGLATPLVISVHSIVSLDFAVSLVPGWHPTIFPPFFVAGAIYSGMAMVLTITIPLRRAARLEDVITPRHLDLMAKVMLVSGLIVAYGYVFETLGDWLSGEAPELTRLHNRIVGSAAPTFWSMIICNVVFGQLLWIRRVRTSQALLFTVALAVNAGMWLERYDIVVTSLEKDYLPSSWGTYRPTLWDWTLFIGTIGCFASLILLFIRLLPVSPVHELKELAWDRGVLDPPSTDPGPRPTAETGGVLHTAAFDSPERLLLAVSSLRRAGALAIQTYTPIPVHGLAEALERPPSRIPVFTLAGAVVGAAAAYSLMYYTSVIDYPWRVAGKPFHSWPSFVPITFELGILGGAIATLVGFLWTSRLPRLHDPDVEHATVDRSSRDLFILTVRADAAAAARIESAIRLAGPAAAFPEGNS